jgi:hypothetical protein
LCMCREVAESTGKQLIKIENENDWKTIEV